MSVSCIYFVFTEPFCHFIKNLINIIFADILCLFVNLKANLRKTKTDWRESFSNKCKKHFVSTLVTTEIELFVEIISPLISGFPTNYIKFEEKMGRRK